MRGISLSLVQSARVNVRADLTGAPSSVVTGEHVATDTATTAGDSTRPSSRTARRTGLARSANGSTPNTRVFQFVRPHDGGSLEGRPCRLLRPALVAVSGADLDVLALVDQLTSSLGQLLRIQTEALDSPDFVEIGAKPTRQDGQRGRRNGGGSPWVPCHLARPRPRGTT